MNKTDNVESAPTIQLRDIIAFAAVIADPDIIRPFLAAKGHSSADIDRMYQAWRRSVSFRSLSGRNHIRTAGPLLINGD